MSAAGRVGTVLSAGRIDRTPAIMPPNLRRGRARSARRSERLMNREYHRWDSPILGRPMELLWFGHAGRPHLGFPTSQGRLDQAEDFGLVGAVAELIEQGQIQVWCVDSLDAESYYTQEKQPAEPIARRFDC
jgi:hypothetical protein